MAEKDVKITIKAEADRAIAKVEKLSDVFKATGKKTQESIDSIDKSLKGLTAAAVGTAIGSIAGQIVNLGISSVKAASQMRNYEIAFSTMLKSADKGKTILQDLQRFAAETPFDVPGVVQSAQQLLAFGFAADEIIPTLRILGDTAAGLGKSSAGVQQIAYALGQIRTSGTLKTQDVNQLTNAGINAWEALAQASGKSIREIKEATEKGMIDSAKAIEVITASMADDFGGMMEARSQEVEGYWNNIVESIGNAQATLGAFAVESDGVKETLKGVSDATSDMSNRLMEARNAEKSFGDAIKEAFPPEVVVAIGAVTAAIGTALVLAIGAAVSAMGPLVAASAAVVAGVAAVGGAIAGLVTYAEDIKNFFVSKAVKDYADELDGLTGEVNEYIDAVKKAVEEQGKLGAENSVADFKRMQDTNTGTKGKVDLLNDDKGLSDYQKNLRKISEEYGLNERRIREVAAANAELQQVQDALARATMSDREAQSAYYQDQINAINAAKEADKQATAEKIAGLEAQKKIWEEAKAAGIDGSAEKVANLEKQIKLESDLLTIRQQTADLQTKQLNKEMDEQSAVVDKVTQAWYNYANSVASGFGSAVRDMLEGSKTVGQALKEMLKNVILSAAQTAAQFLMLVGILSAFRVKNAGDVAVRMMFGIDPAKVEKKANGGYVSGAGTSTSDSIPAMLSNGEYVMRASAVRQIGLPTLNAMNQGRGFADGGLIGAVPVASNTQPASSNSVTLQVSALDASSFEEFLNGGGLDKIKQALFDSDRNFAATAGVW